MGSFGKRRSCVRAVGGDAGMMLEARAAGEGRKSSLQVVFGITGIYAYGRYMSWLLETIISHRHKHLCHKLVLCLSFSVSKSQLYQIPDVVRESDNNNPENRSYGGRKCSYLLSLSHSLFLSASVYGCSLVMRW